LPQHKEEVSDDLSFLHNLKAEHASKDISLFKPLDAPRLPGSQREEVVGAGKNHPSGVMINYMLKEFDEEKDSVALTFMDENGLKIKTFSNKAEEKDKKLEVKQGHNQFVWDMAYQSAKKFDGMIMWSGSLAGPKAAPGKYTVELSVNGNNASAEGFTILANPNSKLTQEDYEAQFNFLNEINKKVSEAHETIIEIREVRKQLEAYKTLASDQKDIVKEINHIDSLMTEVEENLYQTKNQSRQDPLNFPIKLTNKLAHLNTLTGFGDNPPTSQAIALKAELEEKIDDELKSYNKIKEESIPALNNLIKLNQVDAIKIPNKTDKP